MKKLYFILFILSSFMNYSKPAIHDSKEVAEVQPTDKYEKALKKKESNIHEVISSLTHEALVNFVQSATLKRKTLKDNNNSKNQQNYKEKILQLNAEYGFERISKGQFDERKEDIDLEYNIEQCQIEESFKRWFEICIPYLNKLVAQELSKRKKEFPELNWAEIEKNARLGISENYAGSCFQDCCINFPSL